MAPPRRVMRTLLEDGEGVRVRVRVRVRARVRVRLRLRLSDLVAVVPPRHDARVLGRVVAQPPVGLHKVVHLQG